MGCIDLPIARRSDIRIQTQGLGALLSNESILTSTIDPKKTVEKLFELIDGEVLWIRKGTYCRTYSDPASRP